MCNEGIRPDRVVALEAEASADRISVEVILPVHGVEPTVVKGCSAMTVKDKEAALEAEAKEYNAITVLEEVPEVTEVAEANAKAAGEVDPAQDAKHNINISKRQPIKVAAFLL